MSTLTAKQVAGELSMSEDWFRRAQPQLEAEGFPPPLPLPSLRHETGRRRRPRKVWSADAVRDWIRNPRRSPLVSPAAANDAAPARPDIPARDRDILRDRFG